MSLRNILLGTTNWLRSHRYEMINRSGPALDEDGLLIDELDDDHSASGGERLSRHAAPVAAVTTLDRRDAVEKIQEGFNCLADQLQKINDHLGRQLGQHEELMNRVRQLPQLLESFPQTVENHRQMGGELIHQLQTLAARQEQFLNAVGQIPTETARQTRVLGTIHDRLEAASETNEQLVTCMAGVGRTLGHLDASTVDNTAEMLDMRKKAAARDRYLANALLKFQRRIIWLFAGFAVLVTVVMAILIGLTVYLRS
jgi:archaellum component FlaC